MPYDNYLWFRGTHQSRCRKVVCRLSWPSAIDSQYRQQVRFYPQYKELEALYQKYKDAGLVVIGFPCDQFAHQEPGTDTEIEQFCQINFGVTFPLMKKIEVNGENEHPLYTFLKAQAGGCFGRKIKWNFTKFLVSRDGSVIKRYAPATKPMKIEKDIVEMLKAAEQL